MRFVSNTFDTFDLAESGLILLLAIFNSIICDIITFSKYKDMEHLGHLFDLSAYLNELIRNADKYDIIIKRSIRRRIDYPYN
jgi:hypothetical protein